MYRHVTRDPLSDISIPVLCALRVLVHEGNVVMVEGGIMHELKASALSTRDRYYIDRVHYNP